MQRQGGLSLLIILFLSIITINTTAVARTNYHTNYITEYYDHNTQHKVIFSPLLDTTTLFGKMTRNSLGYPISSFSLTPLLGFDIKQFTNIPDREVIEQEANIYARLYPNLSYPELNRILARQLHPGIFTYVNYGTELLLIPKIGTGFMIPFSKEPDNVAYYHLGVQFPLVIQSGFQFAF